MGDLQRIGPQELMPQAGIVTRESFGETEVELRAETAASAVAAREASAVQARYVMAAQRPRNMDMVRLRLLGECDRPRFAEVARYRKPVGKKDGKQTYAEGWSIRFAEAAVRCLGNMYPDASVVYESAVQRIIRFSVSDLETNATYSSEQVINKTVERSYLKDGQSAISERKNSAGKPVYLVHATDDEVQMKQASAWSKFIRNSLRFVPGDILDECLERITATLNNQEKKDPGAARKRLMDGFFALGVTPVDLQSFLGHSLDVIQPKELEELRATYTALRDGDATWAEIMEAMGKKGTQEQADKVKSEKVNGPAKTAPAAQEEPMPDPMSMNPGSVLERDGKRYTNRETDPGRVEWVEVPAAEQQQTKAKFQFGGGKK